MAVARGRNEEQLIRQFWGSSRLDHKQCLKNLFVLMEIGDIDLSGEIVGLPSCPKRDRFKDLYLSKRTDSNPTYKVTYGEVAFVVRMKPPGMKYQYLHRVCLESEVLSYLYRKGLPVPKMYHVESREAVIGTEFIVMEYVDGITFEHNSLPDREPDERRTVYYSVMETLAQLHRVPLGELEYLLDPNKVYDDMTAFWNGQLSIWEGNFNRACPSGNSDVQELFRKMKSLSAPQGRRKSILHHDVNLDNFVFDSTTLKVKALVDWEMCVVGDPLVDLAQSTLPFIPVPREKKEMLKEKPHLAAMLASPDDVPGIPTENELIAHYKLHSGVNFAENELRYAKTVVCLRFLSVFQDATDDNDKHESPRKYAKEVLDFLTKAGYSYCPRY